MKTFIRRVLGRAQPEFPWDNREPVREELFSVERLEEHARSLALAQPVASRSERGHRLAGRLADNADALQDAYRRIVKAIDQSRAITPAAEWLIDNYHLVEKQIREVRGDLPPGYYRQLPKLATGPFAGYPRVFGVAWAFVAHADSRFDVEMLCRYVHAYQDVQPLTIGELWAVSITLRIVLIENLRRLAGRIVDSYSARQEADHLADRLLGADSRAPEPALAVLSDLEKMPLRDAFAVELIHRLRDQDPKVTPVLTWLDDRLAAQATTADLIVREELQRQGSGTVTVRNIITSLRAISEVDWSELFERMSLVDKALGAAGNFRAMDFSTRNLYRSAIEQLARGSGRAELDVAHLAVQTAERESCQCKAPVDERRGDPGYHLIADGRHAFERLIGFRVSPNAWITRWGRALGIRGYAGAGVLVGGIVLAIPLLALSMIGIEGWWLALLGIAGAIPAIDLSVAFVNRFVTHAFGAAPLPALELPAGVPAHLRTLVAVPVLLASRASVEEQIERLEIHHLASPEGELHFALLSDWVDADNEREIEDEDLLEAALEGIAELNRRYGPAPGGDRFLLLHRRRVWNASERRWIGWERKRGKLHELNRLLRGATDTTFLSTDRLRKAVPDDVRYVITLDADTRLPRDTVRRLIGKMAHPLNKPRFDISAGCVVEGYAVLQPRVTPSLPVAREGSRFQRVFSSMKGIDPYGSAISDVYQDLFAQGSYAGKGIYDIDAFEAALANRVPNSTLLSHDLFEGVFARAGLASDVEVVEEFPARYDVAASRHHRWTRGDWQLLPWILGRGPFANADRNRSAIPAMGRWKMIDNLRRTLSAPSAVLSLLIGWSLPLEAAVVWTMFVLATIALPTLIPVLSAIVPQRPGVVLRSHVIALGAELRLALVQSSLLVILLAHQAWSMIDAVGRTLVRLFISRRHLLEWTTAAQAAIGRQLDLAGFYRRMIAGVLVAMVAFLVSLLAGEGTWPLVLPFAMLWAASPAFAYWISQSPPVTGRITMSEDDATALRLTARRTWRFFETFVTPAESMLPPDNFQEDPPAIAHRTSPTNIGLYLLSTASARDFGWIGTFEAVERLEATLATMSRLRRFRGHFYNWYDTQDLRALDPPYVSTVDSGNLAGHLIALAKACEEWVRDPLDDARSLAGIADSLEITRETADRIGDGGRAQTVTRRQLDQAIEALAVELRQPARNGQGVAPRLGELAVLAETIADICRALAIESDADAGQDLVFWAEAVCAAIGSHSRDFTSGELTSCAERLLSLAKRARATALEMEFGFLLDRDRKLLSIGYLASEGHIDSNCYDLLASEARLASFLAIAKNDIAAKHWFRLGRAVTSVADGAALISWSGSMFEYLMPSLVMRAPAESLIERTSRLIVRRQMSYAATLDVPWGMSESAYNARDVELTYQYSNFGIPGLGLKRGLGADTVIAPYATALAAMVDPTAAAANFAALAAIDGNGRYGFYEALDYTVGRVPEGNRVAVIRAFMAHHQGMTIVAIANGLLNGVMRARFHSDALVKATELLLQERTPRDVSFEIRDASDVRSAINVRGITPSGGRRLQTPHGPSPAIQMLSNGRYSVMVTAAGSGYSRWGDVSVTRWREDATCDDWGSYIFLRDVDSGAVWSAGFQPSGVEADDYDVVFNEDRAQWTRRDGTLTTVQEIVVSAEDDAEVRRVSLTNTGNEVREVDLTSYSEIVLAPQLSDMAHPAFSKLFVRTEYLANEGAVLATRRRRTASEPEVWAAHLSVLDGEGIGKIEVETDRARFLGRGGSIRTAIAAIDGRSLSGTVGPVLDPIFALRRRVRVAPGATVRVAFWTIVAASREAVLDLVDKHRDVTAFERASTLAWTQAQVQLRHIGITPGEAGLFQRLAGHLVHATPALRPSSDSIIRGAGAQSSLWPLGISGDLPIVLLRIADYENLDLVHQLLQAHEYWRMKLLAVDLVVLNERASSYVQDLQIGIETLVRTSQARLASEVERTSGRVFVLRADLMHADMRALLISISRAVLVGQRGHLSAQLDRVPDALVPSAKRVAAKAEPIVRDDPLPEDLEFFNGLGGFSDGGREYVTILAPGQSTPAPWINVVANPNFGFQVGTEGGGNTWSANSRENQLTPWSNDPVTDRSGEAIYLRDVDSDDLWSATALPIRDGAVTYVARHGRGYSRFTHTAHEIASELRQFVPIDDSIKISRLRLHNLSKRVRNLSVTAYVQWILAASHQPCAAFITTAIDPLTGAMFAQNRWSIPFGSRIAFADMRGRQDSWTGDRREFVGRNGTLSSPQSLTGDLPLSGKVGAGLDPCSAMSAAIKLLPDESVEIVFFVGQAASAEQAQEIIARYRSADLDAVQADVAGYWEGILGAVQVRTPDRSMDIMLNGWLLYQTLACRMWARAAFYQSSGAFGFRDQLQDGMALLASRPGMTREYLLRAASRQFIEGDVQHWWLAHTGQGVRTRISDDRAWLAYATANYLEGSGDHAVLDEVLPFLEGPRLMPGEHDSFFQPSVSDDAGTLFEHCARAIDHSLELGAHGLPLIGTGDWNDGMNRVGEGGKGESVWLGWFLFATLNAFAPVAEARGEISRSVAWRAHAAALRESLEREAWDGGWYRRGWFDDGTPLGSAASDECQIDSIAQSWGVLSGAAEPARAIQAMKAMERELVLPQSRVALLFKPPFDKTVREPGYIKGYPPGIRENGGQYTHAAVWSVMALARLGAGNDATSLYAMLNPINHARTRADVLTYKVEPYVVAADIYATSPHVGRGGWTWYTGSAGLMQRAGVESILGLHVQGRSLRLAPCIPGRWPGFEVTFRHGRTTYEIRVENPDGREGGVRIAELDGKPVDVGPVAIPLIDDEATHQVRIVL